MLKHNNRTLFLLLITALLLGACKGSPGIGLEQRADAFLGGSSGSFSGADADNPGAVAEGSAMLGGRVLDFTPGGFTLNSGSLGSQAPGSGPYAISGGQLGVSGDTATVDLDVTSTNPDVTNVDLSGTFSLSAAQGAILNPGRSFDVTWDVGFSYFGVPVAFTMIQPLTGTDFVE